MGITCSGSIQTTDVMSQKTTILDPLVKNIHSLPTIANIPTTSKTGVSKDHWSSMEHKKDTSSANLLHENKWQNFPQNNVAPDANTIVGSASRVSTGLKMDDESLKNEKIKESEVADNTKTEDKKPTYTVPKLDFGNYPEEVQKILLGHVDVDVKPKSNIIRLYVCMHNSDYRIIGKSLEDLVYSEIQIMCKKDGHELEVVYIFGEQTFPGVWLDGQRMIQYLTNQIEDGMKTHARGIVMIMSGDKEKININSIPSVIEQQDFQEMKERLNLNNADVFKSWYQQSNTTASEYILQPSISNLNTLSMDKLKKATENLSKILHKSMSVDQKQKYKMRDYIEVTKAILQQKNQFSHFILMTGNTCNQNVSTQNMTIVLDNRKQSVFENLNSSIQSNVCSMQHIQELLQEDLSSCHVSKILIDNWPVDYSDPNYYIDGNSSVSILCEDVKRILHEIISKLLKELHSEKITCRHVTRLYDELVMQTTKCQDASNGFTGQSLLLNHIMEYLENTSHGPFVLYGPSGMGKTFLSSKIVSLCSTSFSGVPSVFRFVGVTPDSHSLRYIVASIQEQIKYLSMVCQTNGVLQKEQEGFLYGLPINFPVNIIIDGLDCADDFDSFGTSWIPRMLPQGVKLILTLTKSACLETTIVKENMVKINLLERIEAENFLSAQIWQQSHHLHIPVAMESCRLPLYMTVLSCVLFMWQDKTLDHSVELPTDLKKLLFHLFNLMEHIYGYERILQLLGILSSIKYGICDKDMCNLLSSISTLQLGSDNSRNFWNAIKTQLSVLLEKCNSKGQLIYRLSHPIVCEIIVERYFSSKITLSTIHDTLSNFFATVKYQNVQVPGDSNQQKNISKSKISSFQIELPFHELYSFDSSCLLKSKLFNFKWICVMLKNVGIYQLLSVLEKVCTKFPERKDLNVLLKVTASSANALYINDKEFVSQICSRLRFSAHSKNNANVIKLLQSCRNSQLPILLVSDNCSCNTSWSQCQDTVQSRPVSYLTGLCKIKHHAKHIVSFSQKLEKIIVWNIEYRKQLRILEGVMSPREIKMLDCVRAVILCDRELSVYNLDSGEYHTTTKGMLNLQLPLYEVSNEKYIISLSHNGMYFNLMDVFSGDTVASCKVCEDRFINSLHVSENGKVLVCSEDAEKVHPILVWNLEDQQLVHDIRVPELEFLSSIATLTADAQYMVCIVKEPHFDGVQDLLLTFDLKSGQLFRKWSMKTGVMITCIATTPCNICVMGQSDGNLLVYSLQEGTCRYEIEGKASSHNKICLSEDGTICLTHDSSGLSTTLSMWNIKKGKLITTFTLDMAATCCELSADGSNIIICLPGHKDIVTLTLHAADLQPFATGHDCVFCDVTKSGQIFNLVNT